VEVGVENRDIKGTNWKHVHHALGLRTIPKLQKIYLLQSTNWTGNQILKFFSGHLWDGIACPMLVYLLQAAIHIRCQDSTLKEWDDGFLMHIPLPGNPHRWQDLQLSITCWKVHWVQGCHNGRFWMKITIRTSARVRIYPADAVLPADGFLPSADAKLHPHGRSLLSAWTRTRTQKNKIKILKKKF
jgi:hypothetical protein